MQETYRVLRPFQWGGKQLQTGDTWQVDVGHPRKGIMLENRYAVASPPEEPRSPVNPPPKGRKPKRKR